MVQKIKSFPLITQIYAGIILQIKENQRYLREIKFME